MDRANRAYIAGLFDGEGCVGTTKSGGRYSHVVLSIAQNDGDFLDGIQSQLGFGHVTRRHRGNCSLQITGKEDVRLFIRLIFPWSLVKREELRLAYAMAGLVGTKGQPVRNQDQREELAKRIKELKKEA